MLFSVLRGGFLAQHTETITSVHDQKASFSTIAPFPTDHSPSPAWNKGPGQYGTDLTFSIPGRLTKQVSVNPGISQCQSTSLSEKQAGGYLSFPLPCEWGPQEPLPLLAGRQRDPLLHEQTFLLKASVPPRSHCRNLRISHSTSGKPPMQRQTARNKSAVGVLDTSAELPSTKAKWQAVMRRNGSAKRFWEAAGWKGGKKNNPPCGFHALENQNLKVEDGFLVV